MKEIENQVGTITIKSLRDIILDAYLTNKDSLVLNYDNFDDIVFEYRNTYKESISMPYFLLDVLIKEGKSPLNKVGIIRNDVERYDEDYLPVDKRQLDVEREEEIIYLCGYCGTVVNSDGSLLDKEIKKTFVDRIRQSGAKIIEKRVHGKCCIEKYK